MGIASECLGITRADLLENLVQQNRSIFSDSGEIEKLTQKIHQLKQENQSLHPEKSGLKAQIILDRDELNSFCCSIIQDE